MTLSRLLSLENQSEFYLSQHAITAEAEVESKYSRVVYEMSVG